MKPVLDATHLEVKLEKQTFGKVFDMAFSPDSKRLVAVGAGSNVHGDAFFIDGGASVGAITQHSKPILSVDYRQERPFRLVTLCLFSTKPEG